eukprot:7110_1
MSKKAQFRQGLKYSIIVVIGLILFGIYNAILPSQNVHVVMISQNSLTSFSKKEQKLVETENKIHIPRSKKNEWFNKIDKKKYESINSDMMEPIILTNFNKDKFINRYQYNIKFKKTCHWLIPNIILIGSDPYWAPSKEAFVNYLVKDGITQFVSLHEWDHRFYKKIIEKHYGNSEMHNRLISLPIPDSDIQDNTKTIQYVEDVINIILDADEKKKIYMHCFKGHGRSGLMSCLLLQAIYGMESLTAIKFLNHIHSVRHQNESDVNEGHYKMPEDEKQFNQIHDLHESMMLLYDKYKSS